MLSHIKIIKELDREARDELATMMTKKVIEKNVHIITQGDNSRNLFLILAGHLKVYVNDEEGNQTILAFLNDGDYCGRTKPARWQTTLSIYYYANKNRSHGAALRTV